MAIRCSAWTGTAIPRTALTSQPLQHCQLSIYVQPQHYRYPHSRDTVLSIFSSCLDQNNLNDFPKNSPGSWPTVSHWGCRALPIACIFSSGTYGRRWLLGTHDICSSKWEGWWAASRTASSAPDSIRWVTSTRDGEDLHCWTIAHGEWQGR